MNNGENGEGVQNSAIFCAMEITEAELSEYRALWQVWKSNDSVKSTCITHLGRWPHKLWNRSLQPVKPISKSGTAKNNYLRPNVLKTKIKMTNETKSRWLIQYSR